MQNNDAGVHLNNSYITTLMFADDIVLLSASENGLRKHLDTLQSFCQVWRMGLNTEKTKICIFGRRAEKHPYLWKRVALERMNAYKYLGMWITTNGHFCKAEQLLSNQVKKALFPLKAAIKNLQFPPVTVSLKLFDAMIIPILCYGCEICGFSERSDLEVVEMNFLNYVLHLPLIASNNAVRGEVGQLPLRLLWKERILHRLCSEDIPVLLKQAMVQACQLGETSNCWISKLKSVFNMAGFSSLFSSSECDAEVRKNILTQKL